MTIDDALSIAVYVLHNTKESRLRAGEITAAAIDPSLRSLWSRLNVNVPSGDAHDRGVFSAELSRKLNTHLRETSASRRVIDGSTNGWKLGPRAGAQLANFAPTLQVTSNLQLLGLAGEYAVMSELLLLDWNVAKPPFDNGVDLFATKGGEVRTVQVKTATSDKLGDCGFTFTGSQRAHAEYNNVHHYYVLVMRTIAGTSWRNSFFSCSASTFDGYLHTYARFNQPRDAWHLVISRLGQRYLINGEKDITNDLDQLQTRFR